MNIYDIANRLAQEIKQSEEYMNYKMAKQALNLNKDLKEKVAEFEKVSFNQFEIDCKKSAYFNNKNIEEIYKNIEIPIRKTKGSAGHDIVSPFDFTLLPNESIMIPTGIHCKISTGWVLMIFVRSSLGSKKGVK